MKFSVYQLYYSCLSGISFKSVSYLLYCRCMRTIVYLAIISSLCEFLNYCLYISLSYSVFSFNCRCWVFLIFLLFNLLYLNSLTEAFVIFVISHLLYASLWIISILHQPVSQYLLLESCQTLDLAILYIGKCYWSILILKNVFFVIQKNFRIT